LPLSAARLTFAEPRHPEVKTTMSQQTMQIRAAFFVGVRTRRAPRE
jgi:hypothetical protein